MGNRISTCIAIGASFSLARSRLDGCALVLVRQVTPPMRTFAHYPEYAKSKYGGPTQVLFTRMSWPAPAHVAEDSPGQQLVRRMSSLRRVDYRRVAAWKAGHCVEVRD
jgi:hypothetical protein